VAIPTHIHFQIVDDVVVLINTKTSQFFELNNVGSEIWLLLVDDNSLESISLHLTNKFSASKEIVLADVEEFVSELSQRGFVCKP
jgi:Coenzyme PQQ synthesis protein D (PqqD)